MKQIGSVIHMMVNEMDQTGLLDPEFMEQHEFVEVLRNGTKGTTGEGTGSGTTNIYSQYLRASTAANGYAFRPGGLVS